MPTITFPAHASENTIAHAMVRAPNASRVFAHPGGFDDAEQAQAHLTRWMTSPPEDHLRRLLDGPMTDVTQCWEAGAGEVPDMRRLGDVVTDDVFVHVLRELGVDPRAALVAMAFHDDEDMAIDGVSFTPSMIDQMASGTMTLHAYILPEDGMEILTDRSRIDLKTKRMPETLIDVLKGRPVRDLVSHRLVDGIDLTITQLSDAGGRLVVDYDGGHDVRLGDITMQAEITA